MQDWVKVVGFFACVGLLGCTSQEEKVLKVINAQLETCKAVEEPFAEVIIQGGKAAILSDACRMPLEGPTLVDEFHARANTGPYFWILGLDKEFSVWVLREVTYDPVTVAKREMEARNATPESLAKADSLFAEAEKAMPESAWIRQARVENALRLRNMVRGKDTENPAGLGEAQAVVDNNIEWASSSRPAEAAQIQLKVLKHLGDYYRRLEESAQNLGSRDDWYIASIELAKKEKDDKTFREYSEELAKLIAERPAERQTLVDRMGQVFDLRCKYITQMKVDGIDDTGLRDQVQATLSNSKCTPEDRPKIEDFQ